MHKLFTYKGMISLCLVLILPAIILSAQNIPENFKNVTEAIGPTSMVVLPNDITPVRKKSNRIKIITLDPNPVTNGLATARSTVSVTSSTDLRIPDLSAKIVLQQQNKITEGNNSIYRDGPDRLPAGIYVL